MVIVAWPKNFPANCPPGDTVTPSGTYFRFLKGALPPTADDLVPDPNQRFSSAGDPIKECQACGLSLLSTTEAVARYRRRYPKGLGQKTVAAICLDGLDGALKQTPPIVGSAHYTWWLADSANRDALCLLLIPPQGLEE